MTAGFSYASGDAIIPMDCDLQDPPDLIPALIERWRAGYKVVHAVRRCRDSDSWAKRTTARAKATTTGVRKTATRARTATTEAAKKVGD